VQISGRIYDIDLYVWPVLGMAQPAQHPRILAEEMLSKRQLSRERADDVSGLDELGRCYEAVGERGKCCPFDTDYG
jgi:hypothetical protein